MFQKSKRYRSDKYLKWVASKPCILCYYDCCQAHHITIAEPKAMGMKVSDYYTVPLCYTHHHQLHMTGEAKFWTKIGINPKFYALLLYCIYNSDYKEDDRYLWNTVHKKVLHKIQKHLDFLLHLK